VIRHHSHLPPRLLPVLYFGLAHLAFALAFVTLLSSGRFTWIYALVIFSGLVAFLSQVVWMWRRRRSRPPKARTPDPAVLHVGASLVWLSVASLLGVWLTLADPSPNTLRVAMAYGSFGLVGFLAQMVVGMEERLLPIFASDWANANTRDNGARALTARDALAPRPGTRVCPVAVRRAGVGGRLCLRRYSVRQRRRLVSICRVHRRHEECRPHLALRVRHPLLGPGSG